MSAHSCRYADAVRLFGAKVATGDRWIPICSMTLALGIDVGRKPGRSNRRATVSRCSRLRRSTIDANGRTIGAGGCLGQEVGELFECALRQRGRDRGHDQRIGGAEDALARQRDPGSTIEERDVVAIGDRLEERSEAAGRVFGVVESEIEVTEREVRGHDVDGRVVGGVDVRQRATPTCRRAVRPRPSPAV